MAARQHDSTTAAAAPRDPIVGAAAGPGYAAAASEGRCPGWAGTIVAVLLKRCTGVRICHLDSDPAAAVTSQWELLALSLEKVAFLLLWAHFLARSGASNLEEVAYLPCFEGRVSLQSNLWLQSSVDGLESSAGASELCPSSLLCWLAGDSWST